MQLYLPPPLPRHVSSWRCVDSLQIMPQSHRFFVFAAQESGVNR